MSIATSKPIEKEDFRQVSPLGTDRSIFSQLETKWRNLKAIRTAVLAPVSVIGSVLPFFFVSIWPLLNNWELSKNAEWWMWQTLSIAAGIVWFWASQIPYKKIKAKEEMYDEALDALDAKDYVNPVLVELSTGRRLSNFNQLTPLALSDMSLYDEKTKLAGPKTEALWKRWRAEEAPVRVCDLFTLEKMILKEQYSAR